MENKQKTIKLIASDLDGTLLDWDMNVPAENREALERCAREGICVVVATGRSRTAVPPNVLNIEGIQYLICANGAKIYDARTDAQIYANCLSREAVESVWEVIENPALMIELFWNGTPYVGENCYRDPERFGVPPRALEYIADSRKPVTDIVAFARAHINEIENINFNYANDDLKYWIYERLRDSDLYTLTSSMLFNFEIGGAGVNKASALEFLCAKLGIDRCETLCFGDNENDLTMIQFAGIGVASGNACAAVKQAADCVTLDNNDGGVAFAIRTILGFE